MGAALARAARAAPPLLIVLGSALGYQCLFAAALGLRCEGYDLLCKSMVARAQGVAQVHGLANQMSFHCGDATIVDLSLAAVVWANDFTWPTEVRAKLQERAAREMQESAVL